MEELNKLEDKLNLLIKEFKATKAESARLKAQLLAATAREREQERRIKELEQAALAMQLGGCESEKAALRANLDTILEGIEKMLESLHE